MIKLTTYIGYYNCALIHSLNKYIPYIYIPRSLAPIYFIEYNKS